MSALETVIEKIKLTSRDIASTKEHQTMALLVVGDDDIVPIVFANDATEQARNAACQAVALTAQRFGARALVWVAEAWLMKAEVTPDTPEEDAVQLARTNGSRREILMITIEELGMESRLLIAPIGVDGGLGVRRVGNFEEQPVDGASVTGRMTNLLPDIVGGEETV